MAGRFSELLRWKPRDAGAALGDREDRASHVRGGGVTTRWR